MCEHAEDEDECVNGSGVVEVCCAWCCLGSRITARF